MMEVEGVVSYMHCDSVDRKTSPQAWIWLGYMFQHNKSTHYYKYKLAKKDKEKKEDIETSKQEMGGGKQGRKSVSMGLRMVSG